MLDDGICSTPVGKYSTPSEAPDVLYVTVSTFHLVANAVHPSRAPEVQHGLCSTLDG